ELGLDEVPTKLQNPEGIPSALAGSGGRSSESIDQQYLGAAAAAAVVTSTVSAPPSPPPPPPPPPPLELANCNTTVARVSPPQKNNSLKSKIPHHSPGGSEG
ncbi:unnamed protein product, partial [Meganyctiphanes norvegica]